MENSKKCTSEYCKHMQDKHDFVRIVSLVLSQTLADSRGKVPEALPMRQLSSVSFDAFDAILDIYTKLLTFSMNLLSKLIVGGICVPWIKL